MSLVVRWVSLASALALGVCAACSSDDTTSAAASGGSAGDGSAGSGTAGSGTAGTAGSGTAGSGTAGSGSIAAPPDGDATYKAVSAAQAFLATLDATQTAAVSFAFDDATQRVKWSNLPTGIFQRVGVRYGDMTDAQKTALKAMLAAILSPKGYEQVLENVAADEVLKGTSSGGMLTFGEAEHFVSILGTPSATSPWMVQFGGHHLAINATVVGATITLAPSLTGGQPTSYTASGATVRPQGAELDLAFALVNALTADQQKTAVIGANYIDLVLGPGKDGVTVAAEGIKGSDLTADQQTQLLALINERVGLVNEEDAAVAMATIKSQLADTYFAWSGPTATGSASYYRVTGPTVFIEYSPQQLGGDATNHTHAMLRDPTNDYGAALIK
jgi:hypothetical protein